MGKMKLNSRQFNLPTEIISIEDSSGVSMRWPIVT